MCIFYIVILESIFCYLFRYLGNIDGPIYILLLLSFNSFLIIYYLLSLKKSIKFLLIVIFGFMARVLLMMMDYSFPDLFSPLYGQGRDDIGFIQQAMELYHYGYGYNSFNAYPYFVATIFNIFGPYELIGRFVNILFSVFSALIFYKILKSLDIQGNLCTEISAIFLFMPWSLFLSVRILREAIPTFLVVCSVYWFLQWMKKSSLKYFIGSLLLLAAGMLFHSGIVGVAAGYLITYTFYNHKAQRLQVNIRSFILSICVLIFAIGIVVIAGDTPLFWKFNLVNSEEHLQNFSQNWSNNTAGTAYLLWLPVYTNLIDMIWQSPIRAFYFIFSPLPWDIKRLQDIIILMFDSSFYIYGCYLFLKYKNKFSRKDHSILSALIISFVVTAFIYGLGTFDYGTAIRHRAKFMSLLFIVVAVILDRKTNIKLERYK